VLQSVELEGIALFDRQVRQSVRCGARNHLVAFCAVDRATPLGTLVIRRRARQQPRNQPTPRRTKFGDGTFLACVGVVLGVVLNALRWGLGLFRASNQGLRRQAPESREAGPVDSVHSTEEQGGCSYGLHNPSSQVSRPGQRERKQQAWHKRQPIEQGDPPLY
jgi:hypothetical protein